MTAQAEVDLTPGSEAWQRLVSASKVSAILGVSPYSSPLETWYLMKGELQRDDETTDAQSRGNYLEPAILAWWRDRHPEVIQDSYEEQRTVWHEDWAIATLDALALTEDFEMIGVEAKSSASWDEWGREGTDDIPRYYKVQTWWQFICAAPVARIYVPVIGPRLDFREYVVERPSDADLDAMLSKVRAFHDSLAGDEPPPLDSHKATLKTLSKLSGGIVEGEIVTVDVAIAKEYVEASLALKEAEERETLAKSRVMQEAGKAQFVETEIPGRKEPFRIASRQQRGQGLPFLKRSAKNWPRV